MTSSNLPKGFKSYKTGGRLKKNLTGEVLNLVPKGRIIMESELDEYFMERISTFAGHEGVLKNSFYLLCSDLIKATQGSSFLDVEVFRAELLKKIQ